MKNFYRKVAFGLKPDEKEPSDPLVWAQKQVETIPELNWKGKYIYSEKEMRKYWITQRVEENTTLRKKFKNDPQGFRRAEQQLRNETHTKCLVEMDDIIRNLKENLEEAYKDTIILTVTEFGRTIKQNGGNGTEHGYGTAIFMAGGLLKKSQVHTDWPGLKRKEMYEGRDLNATIDARSVYASAMSTVFDLDFKRIQKDVFWG
jgi:hypothetical protein